MVQPCLYRSPRIMLSEMAQEFDIQGQSSGRRHPREVDFPWSLLILPPLVILSAISIPCALAAVPVYKWREHKFRVRMKSRGRLFRWNEFRNAVEEGRGTLIVEQHSGKGPFRWWWTDEDIYRECPVPIVEWINLMPNDERYRSLAEWCHSKYTSTETGRARLVEDVPATEIGFLGSAPHWFPESFRFLKVAPPDRLHKYQTVEE